MQVGNLDAGPWTRYTRFWTNYLNVDGLATRMDVWVALVINGLIRASLSWLTSSSILPMVRLLPTMFSLAILIPDITLGIRRLHDAGMNTKVMIFGLIPGIGIFYSSMMMVTYLFLGSNEYYGKLLAWSNRPVISRPRSMRWFWWLVWAITIASTIGLIFLFGTLFFLGPSIMGSM